MSSRFRAGFHPVLWLLSLASAAAVGWWAGARFGRPSAPATTGPAHRLDAISQAPTPAPPPPRPAGISRSEAPAGNVARVDQARTALTQTNPTRRKRAFYAFLETMSAAEAPAVERLIFELNRQGMDFPEEWYAFLARWGELDPAAALALMRQKREAGEPESMISGFESTIFSAWAGEDAVGARQWLDAQPEGEGTDALWSSLISGLAQEDLSAATSLALEKSAPGSNSHKSALEQLSEVAVRQTGVAGMQSWFDALPDESKRDASSHVHWRNMQASLETAATWLSAQSATPWRKDHQIQELASRWIGQDPAAATQWTASLPPGPNQGDPYPGLRASVGAWTAREPDQVLAWLASQQGQPHYDSAVAGVALHYSGKGGDSATAARWLQTIQSPDIRQDVQRAIERPSPGR